MYHNIHALAMSRTTLFRWHGPCPERTRRAVVDRFVMLKGGIRPVLAGIFHSIWLDILLYKIAKPGSCGLRNRLGRHLACLSVSGPDDGRFFDVTFLVSVLVFFLPPTYIFYRTLHGFGSGKRDYGLL